MSKWRGWLPDGTEVEVSGRDASGLFADADRLGCVRLLDWFNKPCIRLRGEWVWL